MAQTTSPAYWQYDARGRLDHVITADVNDDGIDEFVVVAESVNVTLVGADGRPLWTTAYQTETPITQLIAINADGPENPQLEIALGTEDQIILLSAEGEVVWERFIKAPPTAMAATDVGNDGQEELVVGMESGPLRLYDSRGGLVWEYPGEDNLAAEAALPQIQVGDVDGDGQAEIAFSYYDQRRISQLALVNADGNPRWSWLVPGQITSLALMEVEGGTMAIAAGTQVGTGRGRVHLFDADGEERWYRTPNKPVTALAAMSVAEEQVLVVGTSVGTVITYDEQGRRAWSRPFSETPDREVIAISARPPTSDDSDPVALLVTLAVQELRNAEPVEVLLLDGDGRILERYETADTAGLSRLVNVNADNRSELLLSSFGTLELLDPGIGVSTTAAAWDYRLGAQPRSALVADLDQDGQDELLIGTADGRLHLLQNEGGEGQAVWVEELGGVITHLGVAENTGELGAEIVAIHNNTVTGAERPDSVEGVIEVLRRNGQSIWRSSLPTAISGLLVSDINSSTRSEILVGATDGQIIAYSPVGEEFWRASVNGSVEHLVALDGDGDGRPDIAVSSRANELHRFNNKGGDAGRITFFLNDINSLLPLALEGEEPVALLAAVEDGFVRALAIGGAVLWEHEVEGIPTLTAVADHSFLVATDEATLIRLAADGSRLWTLTGLGRITSLYWGDLDGDARPDLAAGNREGQVHLCAGDGSRCWGRLNLPSASGVFHLSAIRRAADQPAELVVIAENGVVQLFRSQPNRAPLLVSPQTDVSAGRYSINVTVLDVERDDVAVTLELFNPETGTWEPQGERSSSSGNGLIFWPVDPPAGEERVRYRFLYDDGAHRGTVEPRPGPAAVPPDPFPTTLLAAVGVVLLGSIVAGGVWARQAQSPGGRARKFYRQVKQAPQATLALLETAYGENGGSPDFLLNLANVARRENHRLLASLADGLYLMGDRPAAGLPVIGSALQLADEVGTPWEGLALWKATYQTGQALLDAPSITELSLLRPQFIQLLDVKNEARAEAEPWSALLKVMNNLRDSERVDLAEDRLVYLNEASARLKQLLGELPSWVLHVEHDLVAAIGARWSGLVNAGIEELRGRARLDVTLKTKRLAPAASSVIALEVVNSGRAPAEQIVVAAESSPAYQVLSEPETIAALPPGRRRTVNFTIVPEVDDRFRLAFIIRHHDRHSLNNEVAFADMVHILPPARPFDPIPNPYLPGTPLRRHSSVFYGREELFGFIADNAGHLSQRNVLILVGQRRTGKTSALLRLDHYLPPEVVPIYVDCQSLGVVPGMAAFVHDVAWVIADALAARGHRIEVPEPEAWQSDPAGQFQRHFIPAARALLPPGTTLLLIFDEFEAFENLVNDNILPPTLFPYLRHLMQHAEGLGFVFVGTRRLEEMSTDYWSVLFNIALYRHIGYLGEAAATRLICEPVAPHIVYDDLALDKILRVTAGHPYFLQLVCYTLVNRANQQRAGYVTISDVNAALDEMLRLGEVHFAYLWQRSSQTERALLTAVAHLLDHDQPFRPAELVNYLAGYGIVLAPAAVTAGLQRLVEREIMQAITDEATTLYELRVGLVGLWVAGNKSLSQLYESRAAAA